MITTLAFIICSTMLILAGLIKRHTFLLEMRLNHYRKVHEYLEAKAQIIKQLMESTTMVADSVILAKNITYAQQIVHEIRSYNPEEMMKCIDHSTLDIFIFWKWKHKNFIKNKKLYDMIYYARLEIETISGLNEKGELV